MTARRFANTTLVATSGLFALAAVYSLVVGGTANLVPRVLPAMAIAVVIGAALLLEESRRVAAAIVLLTTMVVLWGGDWLVAQFPLAKTPDAKRVQVARRAGVNMDPRSALRVAADLRRAGFDAYPTLYAGNYWRGARQFTDTLYPLGGIGGVLSVMCSEGNYVVYRADERGLTNVPGAWRMPRADIAAVGDSYTQGWCVPPEASFTSRIIRRYPSTIVLGFGASGPLTQLAQMREFLPPLRPRVVLWFYFEGNDLPDLTDETGNPILMRYLEPRFTQRLSERQDEVNARLKAFVAYREGRAARTEAAAAAVIPRTAKEKVSAVVRLTHVRERLAALGQKDPVRPCCDLELYRRVVNEAKALVYGWGGRLAVVYLPSEPRLSKRSLNAGERAADSVLAVLGSLDVPVLDLRVRLLEHASARELTVYPNSHYSVRGHQAVADLVLEYLAARDSLWGLPRDVGRR